MCFVKLCIAYVSAGFWVESLVLVRSQQLYLVMHVSLAYLQNNNALSTLFCKFCTLISYTDIIRI